MAQEATNSKARPSDEMPRCSPSEFLSMSDFLGSNTKWWPLCCCLNLNTYAVRRMDRHATHHGRHPRHPCHPIPLPARRSRRVPTGNALKDRYEGWRKIEEFHQSETKMDVHELEHSEYFQGWIKMDDQKRSELEDCDCFRIDI